MQNDELATIQFIDADSGERAIAIVRHCGANLGVAISIEGNGDVEVFLDKDSAARLAGAIDAGVEMMSGGAADGASTL